MLRQLHKMLRFRILQTVKEGPNSKVLVDHLPCTQFGSSVHIVSRLFPHSRAMWKHQHLLSGRLLPGSFGSLLGLVLTCVLEHIPQEVIYKLSDVATSAAAAREASSWVLLQLADALADAGVDVTRLSELAQEVRLRAVLYSARVCLFAASARSVFCVSISSCSVVQCKSVFLRD